MPPQQGAVAPGGQVTVDPGGTTTVVFFGGGGFSWKLKQPPSASGSSTAARIRYIWVPFPRKTLYLVFTCLAGTQNDVRAQQRYRKVGCGIRSASGRRMSGAGTPRIASKASPFRALSCRADPASGRWQGMLLSATEATDPAGERVRVGRSDRRAWDRFGLKGLFLSIPLAVPLPRPPGSIQA